MTSCSFQLTDYSLKEAAFWANQVTNAEKLFSVGVLPELVGKWFSRNNQTLRFTHSDAGEEDFHCYCATKNLNVNSEMTNCNNPSCPYKWFHLACLGLTNKNKVA